MVDAYIVCNNYRLWQQSERDRKIRIQITDALLKSSLADADPSLKKALVKVRENIMTLSERKREELTDLLMCYAEPLMDRFQ